MSMHLIRGVTVTHKSKVKKKPGWAKAQAEHDAWLRSHGIDPNAKKTKSKPSFSNEKRSLEAAPYRRETKHWPSAGEGVGNGLAKPNPVYTGTLIKGIATMHKSNAVPIIDQQQAIDIANMRRN